MSVSDRWNAQRNALAVEVLRGSGRLRVQVHGESMLPTLLPGDLAELEACSLDSIKMGEIVCAVRDNRFFLHRLRARAADGMFLTRGDSMPGPDPEFSADAFVGKLAIVTRAGKPVVTKERPWSRALGLLFCHCSLARRITLRLRASRDSQPIPAASVETA